jgi:hypothetical protein
MTVLTDPGGDETVALFDLVKLDGRDVLDDVVGNVHGGSLALLPTPEPPVLCRDLSASARPPTAPA